MIEDRTDDATAPEEGDGVHALFLALRSHGGRPLRLREGVADVPDHGESVDCDDLYETDGTGDLLELPVRYDEQCGNAVNSVNHDVLFREFGVWTFVNLYDSRIGVRGLALPAGRPLPWDNTANSALRDLVRMMARLENHPLLDEERYSDYIHSMADHSWHSHLRKQVRHELCDLAPNRAGRIAVIRSLLEPEESIRAAYYGFEGNEWTDTGPSSVRNRRHDDAVRHVAATLFDWEV